MSRPLPPQRRPVRSASRIDPLVGEIAEALLTLGGAAHRDQVIARLEENRRQDSADLDLRARAVAVFDAHSRSDAGYGGVQPLFRRPFGPGAYRWALTAEAEAFLRTGSRQRRHG